MASANQQSHFSARVYDGTGTPYYVNLTLLDPPTIPLTPPRPDTTTILGGQRAVAGNVVQLVTNEVRIFEKISFTIRIALQSERLGLIHALGNPFNASPWSVFGDTWTPVAAGAIGNRINAAGNAIAAQLPADQVLLDGVFNFVMVNDVPPNAPAGVVFAANLKGCTFDGQVTMPVEQDQVFVEVPIACFGEIDTTITAYPAGNEST